MRTPDVVTLSELINHPKDTVARLRASRRRALRLTRRDDEDLLLTTAARAEQDAEVVAAATRVLAAVLRDPGIRAQPLPNLIRDAFPWVDLLSAEEVEEFVSELAAAFEVALELESSAPVVAVLDQWKDAAAAHADPEIAAQLLTERTGVLGAAAPMPRVVTVQLRTYKDTTQMARHLRSRAAVIMNVSGMDDAEATRALNFASGMVFGLHGTIEQITDTVFLLTPKGTTVEGALSDSAATGAGRDSARR
jgi:hypothetical protein